ncbi:glycosyltransferase family 4 protein [Paenibacillaceae bacterium WGS1546]|uniref:glycosyltransferase family 4 protein n=1 Tax=Cohnella sp. WGS1546 TaxID=3366810 RepID=UPI00372D0EDD
MNIAFDMFFARTEAMKRGIGRYSQNMIEAILGQDENHAYYYFYPDISQGAEHLKDQLQQFLYRNRIDVYHMTSPFNLFHLPGHLFHAYSDAMLTKAWFGYTRVAATLYDVIPLVLEKQYMNEHVRPIYMRVIEMIRSCDIVYAISETTKRDAVRLAGMDPDKIRVIMGGYDPKFRPMPGGDPLQTARRYGIHRPYVLCTGGDDPRKNLVRLVDAFIVANRLLHGNYQLAIVYNASEQEKNVLHELASSLDGAGSVVVTGYVPDEDLVALYNGAELFAFPSLYEGFGLPVVEAMACGTPVLTSYNSSLAEISEHAAYLVDPENRDAIAHGLFQLLSNPPLLKDMAAKGLEQAKKFGWADVARKVLDGYETVFRRKIAVFSADHPFLPDTHGPLREAIPYLTDRSEVDVYVETVRDPNEGHDPDSPIKVYPHAEFASRKSRYDYILYELGNEDRYRFIVPYLDQMSTIPGIAVLNGDHLHELTWKWTIGRNSLDDYYRVMAREYGSNAQALMDRVLCGAAERSDVPLVRYYLGCAKSIIVYDPLTLARLRGQGYRNVLLSAVPALAPVENGSSGGSTFRFASFAADPERPLDPAVIRALRSLADQGCAKFHFTLLGRCDPAPAEELRALAARYGLERNVSIVGGASLRQYKQAIRKTNAVVLAGEASSGQSPYAAFAAMAAGIPAIVPDEEPYRQLPEELAIRVPAGAAFEASLAEAMLRLYRGRSEAAGDVAEAAERLRAAHSVALFAERLQEAIELSGSLGENPTVYWHIQQSPDGVPRIRNL